MFYRAEMVRWIAESLRPFSIVKDRGFLSLMKTGRPEYWLPSPSTLARDVRQVFIKCRARISTMLQVRSAASSNSNMELTYIAELRW